jgi:hypothetical protein
MSQKDKSRRNGNPDRASATIEDPHEWNRQRRFEEIHEAREHARHALTNVNHPEVRHRRQDRETIVFDAVKTYAIEVEPLLMRMDVGEVYLEKIGFNPIVLTPPEESRDWFTDNYRKVLPDEQLPEEKTVQLQGLSDYIELAPPLSARWVVNYRSGGNIETKSWEKEISVPRHVSERAYRNCNLFLAQIGVDVGIVGDDHESGGPGV